MITWYHETKEAPDFDKRIAICEEDGTWAYMDEIEKADVELEKLKKEKEAKKGTGNKKVLQTLIAYELHRGEVEEVLIKFGWVRKDAYFMESELYCWLEREPSDEDIKKVLTEIGYDVSKL